MAQGAAVDVTADISPEVEAVVDKARSHMWAGGIRTTADLLQVFEAMDFDGSGALDRKEFTAALQMCKIFLTSQEIGLLFRELDTERRPGVAGVQDNRIRGSDFERLLMEQSTSERRTNMLQRVFTSLERKFRRQRMTVRAVMERYKADAHPDVKSGALSAADHAADVAAGLDNGQGEVEWGSFLRFYLEVGSAMPSDAQMVELLSGGWGVAEAEAADVVEGAIGRFEAELKAKVAQRQHGNESEVHCLERLFRRFDLTDDDGLITREQFKQAMEFMGGAPDVVVESVFDEFGDEDDELDYKEYAAHVLRNEAALTSTSLL